MTPIETEFDPESVLKLVQAALVDHPTLSVTFVETQMYERLPFLLGKYLSQADISWMLSELRDHFFNGFTKIEPEQFYGIIKNCRKCPNSMVQHPGQVSVWNNHDPDIMIVVDSPYILEQYGNALAHHLKEAGFTSGRCSVTFLARCLPLMGQGEHAAANCLPYLHTEMALLNPKLIVPLGLSAYRCVTGDSTSSMAKLRGDIQWFGPFAILPESSYGWAFHSKPKEDDVHQSFISSFKKAHQFIYGTN